MREVRDETALWQLHQSEREERGERRRGGGRGTERAKQLTTGALSQLSGALFFFRLFLLFYFLSITQFDPFRFCLHLFCNGANFGIDLIPSKYRASISETNTNTDTFNLKDSL